MSLIGKNPFVNEVLTSCSAEQLTSLSALINNLGSPTVIKLKELKNTDKGVKYASVFLDDFTLVHGLWIFTNTKCGLFAFQNGFNEMQAIRIDTVNKNYEYIYQHLSVAEFRSTLDECMEAQGGEATPWEKDLKPNLYYDKANDDIVVKKSLVDANGNAIIPNAYTKTESDNKFDKKTLNIRTDSIAQIDPDTKVITGVSGLTVNQKVTIVLERTSDNLIFGTGIYYDYSSVYTEIICTPLMSEVNNDDDTFITAILINKETNVCMFRNGDNAKNIVFSSLRIY